MRNTKEGTLKIKGRGFMWWDKAVYSKSYYVRLNQAVCRQQRTLMKNFQAKD